MTVPSLHIHRWRNDFRVPRGHIAPERARVELEAIAERLPEELAAGLAPWCSTQAGPVVLVERLVFDCELDLSREPELLATRWAYHFAKALVNAVESGAEGVLRFPSPAAYRAQFIADAAAGHGSGAWYYRPFAGLSALPPAGVIRTVLLEDQELGRETLIALPSEAWDRLGRVLTRRESFRILDGLSVGGSLETAQLAALAALYREQAPRLPAAAPVAALFLFTAALRAGFGPSPELARWLWLAAQLPSLAVGPDAPALAEALRRGEVVVPAAAGSESAAKSRAAWAGGNTELDWENWEGLALKPEWRASLAAALRLEIARTTALHATADPVQTAYGGLVLLLPELEGLLDEALSSALPAAEPASARGLTAWLVLAQCTGQAGAARFLGEAFWRDLFAVPEAIDREFLRLWLADADAAPAAARLDERAAALARGAPLPTPLRIRDRRLMIPVDQPTGIWCAIRNPLAPEEPYSLSLWERAGVRGSNQDSLPLSTAPSVPWRARLAAARRARGDWRYLAMDWGLPEAWQRLFTQLAQILLRRFAYRIPGFAGTSLPHLYANFLAGSGTLDSATGHFRLARPPLHVLLNLTGIGRSTVRWSGPPERSFLLDYEP